MDPAKKGGKINAAPDTSLPTRNDQVTKKRDGEYAFETPGPSVNGYSSPYNNCVANWSDMVTYQPLYGHPGRVLHKSQTRPETSYIEDSTEPMSVRYNEGVASRVPPVPQVPNGSFGFDFRNLRDGASSESDPMQWQHETQQLSPTVLSRELLNASRADGRQAPRVYQISRHAGGSLNAAPGWTEAPQNRADQRPFVEANRKRSAALRTISTELSNDIQRGADSTARPRSSTNSVPPGLETGPWTPPFELGNQNALQHTTYSCIKCDTIFRSYDELSSHIRLHTHLYECPYGCRRFKFEKDLKRHATIHSNERPFLCPYKSCEYARRGFKRRDNLKSHVKTKHLGPRAEQLDSGDRAE